MELDEAKPILRPSRIMPWQTRPRVEEQAPGEYTIPEFSKEVQQQDYSKWLVENTRRPKKRIANVKARTEDLVIEVKFLLIGTEIWRQV